MIRMRLLNSPGYPTTNPNYLGTVHRYRDGAFAVGVNADYASTLEVRRYLGGAEPPNYPMPAIRVPTFDSLYELGYASALNDFDLDAVFRLLRM